MGPGHHTGLQRKINTPPPGFIDVLPQLVFLKYLFTFSWEKWPFSFFTFINQGKVSR
jgi:hypothetical protein